MLQLFLHIFGFIFVFFHLVWLQSCQTLEDLKLNWQFLYSGLVLLDGLEILPFEQRHLIFGYVSLCCRFGSGKYLCLSRSVAKLFDQLLEIMVCAVDDVSICFAFLALVIRFMIDGDVLWYDFGQLVIIFPPRRKWLLTNIWFKWWPLFFFFFRICVRFLFSQ